MSNTTDKTQERRAKQNYKLKDYKTRNTNRKCITSLTGHMAIKQENTRVVVLQYSLYYKILYC